MAFIVKILLQPVINYTPAKEKGLGRSLFQRYAEALEEGERPVGVHTVEFMIMLKTQYRMVQYSYIKISSYFSTA